MHSSTIVFGLFMFLISTVMAKKTFKQIFPVSMSLILLAVASPVFALTKLAQPAPGSGKTLQDFIALLIEIIQAIGIPLLVICIIYAGFIIVTADGNEEKVTKGKTWIFWTLIGAAIIVSAQVIANLVYSTAGLF